MKSQPWKLCLNIELNRVPVPNRSRSSTTENGHLKNGHEIFDLTKSVWNEVTTKKIVSQHSI